MPALAIVRLRLDELSPDPRNARVHDARNLEAIKASLTAFGQQKPIVVAADGTVVAGNGTVEAARALGWTEIDAVRTALTGAQALAYALADNRTAELASWDDGALAALLKELAEDGGLEGVGFDEREVERLLREAGIAAAGPEDDGRSVDIHALRMTCASRLQRRKVPVAVVAKILGHADVRLTVRAYSDFGVDEVRRAVERAW